MSEKQLNRRNLLRGGMTLAAAGGAAAFAFPAAAQADGTHHEIGHEGNKSSDDAEVARIHRLESAFHQARSKQDINLLMSLWAHNPTFKTPVGTVLTGNQKIRAFFMGSASFTGTPLMAFAPTFKGQIRIRGSYAEIYFECHDVDIKTGLTSIFRRCDVVA